MLVGFAVGDALGAPAAGLRASDVLLANGPLSGFVSNPSHPLLGHLKPGQYTENTRLLLDAVRDCIASRGFDPTRRARSLGRWAEQVQRDGPGARWPGPTTLAASHPWKSTGRLVPQSSESIGGLYRVPPISVLPKRVQVMQAARNEVRLTHDSSESQAAGAILALLLHGLLSDQDIPHAATIALRDIERAAGRTSVGSRSASALTYSESTLEERRQVLGTGAVALESLPLSLHISSRYPRDFSRAVVAAANSFRPDWVKPSMPCNSMADELINVNGGNTDGIAALTGCILGAALGIRAIEERWKSVEGYEEIVFLGHELVSALIADPAPAAR